MGEKQQSSYRTIVSSTAIFGGAQALNIVINVIRGKLVAVILHSAGLGIMSLLTNAANTLQQFSLLGINIAAVPGVSQASESDNGPALAFTVRLVRTLVLLASVLGVVLTLAFSPLMSQISFGSTDYLPYFLLLSLAVGLNVLGAGETAVMQGLRRYKQLAFCSIVPPACGLLLSIPIYYIWGTDGIVPAMIVMGAVYYAVLRLFSYRNPAPQRQAAPLSPGRIWHEGREIIQFGIVMTLGTVVGTITTYALMTFISNAGSVSHVGFYQAGNTITMQYIGMIFTAMATDFYPRLSRLVQEKMGEARRLVNQQTEIVLLVVTPLAMLLILTAPLLIKILLTSEFLAISNMMRFMGLACIFKALCFPMDYIAYAKGDKQYLLWCETVWSNLKTFSVIATCYLLLGLDGLGLGALLSAVIDVLTSIVLTRWRYGFRLSRAAMQLLGVMLVLALACFGSAFIPDELTSYSLMTATCLAAAIYSIWQLNRRIGLRALLAKIKNRGQSQAE